MIRICYDEKKNLMNAEFDMGEDGTAAGATKAIISIIVGLVNAFEDATNERRKEILIREIEDIRNYIDNSKIEDVHSGE